MVYQDNLLEAIDRYAPDVDICFYAGGVDRSTIPKKYRLLNNVNQGKLFILLNLILRSTTAVDFQLHQALFNTGVDATFNLPMAYRRYLFYGKRIATLSWIPDFQHVRYPDFFTAEDIMARDRSYKHSISSATLVILSSNDAYRDYSAFVPEFSHKARIMNFVAYVPDDIYSEDLKGIVNKYNIPEKFIYLPNQFWKHKNHGVVIEALKVLKEKGITPDIVCTGNQNDYRNPSYFNELSEKMQKYSIRNQVYLLGMIPHDDVYRLIRHSICLINPSLFEGWSTSVEEAKSIGKSIILSDIPVHREQNPPEAYYFNPHDPSDLAGKVEKIWAEKSPGPDHGMEGKARNELPVRMKRYADTFSSIVNEAIDMVK